jgi:hypothetical protein
LLFVESPPKSYDAVEKNAFFCDLWFKKSYLSLIMAMFRGKDVTLREQSNDNERTG